MLIGKIRKMSFRSSTFFFQPDSVQWARGYSVYSIIFPSFCRFFVLSRSFSVSTFRSSPSNRSTWSPTVRRGMNISTIFICTIMAEVFLPISKRCSANVGIWFFSLHRSFHRRSGMPCPSIPIPSNFIIQIRFARPSVLVIPIHRRSFIHALRFCCFISNFSTSDVTIELSTASGNRSIRALASFQCTAEMPPSMVDLFPFSLRLVDSVATRHISFSDLHESSHSTSTSLAIPLAA